MNVAPAENSIPSFLIGALSRSVSIENSARRIDNDSYSLIDKGDILEIYPEYDSEQSVDVAKALVIRAVTPDPDEEPQIVGFIFPIAE